VNTTGTPLDFWADYTSGLIRGPPGVYRTDVVSHGQWNVGENALTGTYTIALVNITAWASSYETPLDSSILFYQSPSFNIYEARETTMQTASNCSLAGGSATWNASATPESLDTTSQCPSNVT